MCCKADKVGVCMPIFGVTGCLCCCDCSFSLCPINKDASNLQGSILSISELWIIEVHAGDIPNGASLPSLMSNAH